MAKREVVNVGIHDRGLFMVDEDPKECDFCDEKKVCASINTITIDVMCVCKDCLLDFANAFEEHPPVENLNDIPKETPVVAKYGHNTVLDKPFEFLYEFGYYTERGCVVYIKGECNMQDSYAFKMDQIRIATPEDLKEHYWGK